MSRRISFRAAPSFTALIVFASLTAHAADPNALPREPAATAKPAASPAIRPSRPGVRSPASFTPEMPFGEAIDILRHSTTPPLNIVVLWRDVGDNAGIYRETPIGIDGIPGLRMRQYLELLVLSLSAGASARLDYTVYKGVVTIGTADNLPRPKQVTRVYDVSDLVAPPAQYFFPPMGYGGMGYGGMGYGGMGYGGMGYGGQMGAAGGYGAGYGLGGSYGPAGSYGTGGLSGFMGGLYGGNAGISSYRGR